MRALLLICVILLSSCASSPLEKINSIRAQKLPALEKQLAAKQLAYGAPAFIRIFKQEGELELWIQNGPRYELFKTYGICAMSGGPGPKTTKGDHQAPEGFYEVNWDRLWPGSKYHLAMNVGYPNAYDKAHGRTGNALMIHGKCFSEGCFAMTSPYIEEIYMITEGALMAGQKAVPVHIFPFRMTAENLALHSAAPWAGFWQNLRQGYDLFEKTRIPPAVRVAQKSYVF